MCLCIMLRAICQLITIWYGLWYLCPAWVLLLQSGFAIWRAWMRSLLSLQDAHSFFSIDIGNENHIGPV